MTIRRVDFWQLAPDKVGEFLDLGNQIYERIIPLGAVRKGLAAVTGGGMGNRFSTLITDFASMAAYGTAMDAFLNDQDGLQLWNQLLSAGSPAQYLGNSVLRKLAQFGADEPDAVGAISSVRIWQATPDQEALLLSAFEALAPHQEPLGGHTNVWRAEYAGPNAGNLVSTTSFPNWAALGQWNDMLASDPQVRRTLEPFQKAGVASTQVSATTAIRIN